MLCHEIFPFSIDDARSSSQPRSETDVTHPSPQRDVDLVDSIIEECYQNAHTSSSGDDLDDHPLRVEPRDLCYASFDSLHLACDQLVNSANDSVHARLVATAAPHTAPIAPDAPVRDGKVDKHKHRRRRAPARAWSRAEHERFEQSLELYGRNWERCAAYIGTRRAQLVRSHAQKHLIKLWKLGKPLPKKVAESGTGYTLSGKPLLADSASARSYLTRIPCPRPMAIDRDAYR